MGKTCTCYPILILATSEFSLSNNPSVSGGGGLCMGASVCSHLLTDARTALVL